MKKQFIIILSLLCSLNILVAQNQDTLICTECLSQHYCEENNWVKFLQEKGFKKDQKVVVYGDSSYKVKLFEINYYDSKKLTTMYNMKGKLTLYRLESKNPNNDTLFTQKGYYNNGDLSYINIRNRKFEKIHFEKWKYNYMGNLIKTTDVDNSITSYDLNFDDINKNEVININLSPNDIFKIGTYKGNGYWGEKTDLTKEMQKLDSLPYFTNIKSFSIYLDPKYNSDSILQNKLSILPMIKSLKKVSIYGGGFKEVPKYIYECENLEYLEIVATQIHDISRGIERLNKINCLYVDNKNLNYEEMLNSISHLSSLYCLIMPFDLNNKLPQNIVKLDKLRILDFSHSCICNDDVDRASKLTKTHKRNLILLTKLNNLKSLTICYKGKQQYNFIDSLILKNENFYPEYYYTCFPAGTKITLSNGNQIEIEKIKVNEKILAYNEETKMIDTTSVKKLHIHQVDSTQLINIYFKNDNNTLGNITATSNHPFYSDGEWKKASNLNIGDKLLHYINNKTESVTIYKIDTTATNAITLYNLNTNLHTYIANNIVVHNK